MRGGKNGPVRVRYFSWAEYFSLLAASALLAALPGILYGADRALIWSWYTLYYMLYWAIVAGILCAITAWQKYHKFEKPIRKLSAAAQKVASGDFSVYLEPDHTLEKRDYIDVMYNDFNRMVAELGSIETLKNDFIAQVSHEIKTPLAVIRNYTAALKKENLPEPTRQEYMDTVIAAADKLTALVTNILRLNKLENQEIQPQAAPFDLCRQLCDCALRFEALWERKGIDFQADVEDRAIVTADADMLEIVWNNLLSNAWKFTPEGGRITLTQTSDENTVTVSVSDTGCGMDDETMKHIFDKFYQGDPSHAGEGNGVGLALARRVVERADGTLSVVSRPGRGSTFTVVLPIS